VTVILSTHIVDDVRELCPRMAIISNGELLLEGAPSEALDSLVGKIWSKVVSTDDELRALEAILRDFQRDTVQILFTKPISKVAYLGGRWAGSFVATVIAFSGLLFGEFFGTLAPWADHSRIAPTIFPGICSRSFPSLSVRFSFWVLFSSLSPLFRARS